MKRPLFPIHLVLAAALIFLSGCSLLLPQTTALKSVHETYRNDFASWAVPTPSPNPPLTSQTGTPFDSTLESMRKFRARYGETSTEAAHLTILEGMIYLQTGRLGMAKLINSEVRTAGTRLSSGNDTRDALFAESFDDLLKGWTEIHDKLTGAPGTTTEWEILRDAADGIIETLDQKVKAKKLADPDGDQGGIYLATTAAIFYVWAYNTEQTNNPLEAERHKTDWYKKARNSMGNFLSATEKAAAADPSLTGASEPRLRYLQWYAYLGQ